MGTDPVPAAVVTNVTEFKQLKIAVEQLFNHTLKAFNSQKQFTENAAHELQTPLAASINKLEILFSDIGNVELFLNVAYATKTDAFLGASLIHKLVISILE